MSLGVPQQIYNAMLQIYIFKRNIQNRIHLQNQDLTIVEVHAVVYNASYMKCQKGLVSL